MFDVYLPIAQQEFNILILIAIGFSVGVLGGFFGVGGAWVVTPALNIFGFPMAYAIGTDLAHIFGKSIIATAKHAKMGNVDLKLGVLSILGSIIGVEVGAQVVMYLAGIGAAGMVIRYSYMVLLFGLGFWMLYDYATKDKRALTKAAAIQQGATTKKPWILPPMVHCPASGITISLWIVLGVFFVTGFLSGFLGVGGGFIRMPALIYLIGCPTAVAVGTDLFAVLFAGAYGAWTYAVKGVVDIVAALYMLAGAAIGAQIGVTAVKYIRGYGIRLLFAIMIIMAGVSVVLKQMSSASNDIWNLLAAWVVMGSSLGMCAIIMVRLWLGFQREKVELKKEAAKQAADAKDAAPATASHPAKEA